MKKNNVPIVPPTMRSCVSPEGCFVFGIHQPDYRVTNMRIGERLEAVGEDETGRPVLNEANFPCGDISVSHSQWVFEIANPLPFRGTTYIGKQWADRTAINPAGIEIEKPTKVSLSRTLDNALGPIPDKSALVRGIIAGLPKTLKLAAAVTCDDPEDLVALAETSCTFCHDPRTGRPLGLTFQRDAAGHHKAKIADEQLFDLVANNPFLPDDYKKVMVLRPGVQGDSEITGEWQSPKSHVYEYLRSNSYIAGGHYAANMADDAVRYDVGALNSEDIRGLRHLYYQRTYVRMAQALGIEPPARRRSLSPSELENLRCAIVQEINGRTVLDFTATLWGWNYGFDYAPSGYRLHASHQQIHQQYALIPESVSSAAPGVHSPVTAYACGDLVQAQVCDFRQRYDKGFFDCYLQAIAGNQRIDGDDRGPRQLVVYGDDQVMLFVPKAQTSQWELQLMAVPKVGNILETDGNMRCSLDKAMLLAMQILTRMGADMITVIEYSKRFHVDDDDQRLLYAFLPRLPESPGAFSEAQLRWINGHYPEDFAQACRSKLNQITVPERSTGGRR